MRDRELLLCRASNTALQTLTHADFGFQIGMGNTMHTLSQISIFSNYFNRPFTKSQLEVAGSFTDVMKARVLCPAHPVSIISPDHTLTPRKKAA